jgi:hypothetical protein
MCRVCHKSTYYEDALIFCQKTELDDLPKLANLTQKRPNLYLSAIRKRGLKAMDFNWSNHEINTFNNSVRVESKKKWNYNTK